MEEPKTIEEWIQTRPPEIQHWMRLIPPLQPIIMNGVEYWVRSHKEGKNGSFAGLGLTRLNPNVVEYEEFVADPDEIFICREHIEEMIKDSVS